MNKPGINELHHAIENIYAARRHLSTIANKLFPVSSKVRFRPVGLNGIVDNPSAMLTGKIERVTVVYEEMYHCEINLEIHLDDTSKEWVFDNVSSDRFKIDYKRYPVMVNALDYKIDLRIVEDA